MWAVTSKNADFSADFAQVFSFGSDAFVAAPQAVEARALQPLGCHGGIMELGWIRELQKLYKKCQVLEI